MGKDMIQIREGSRVKVRGFGVRDLYAKVNEDKGMTVNCTVYRDKGNGFTSDIARGSIIQVVRY